MSVTTPTNVSADILKFASRLSVEAPIWLDVLPAHGAAFQECFSNTARKVRADGGAVQHGWTIWEWPNVVLEAEFHAVWRAPDGKLVDCSPKFDKEKRILFVPDTKRVYEGKRVFNRRMPLSKLGQDMVSIYLATDQLERREITQNEFLQISSKYPRAMKIMLIEAID